MYIQANSKGKPLLPKIDEFLERLQRGAGGLFPIKEEKNCSIFAITDLMKYGNI